MQREAGRLIWYGMAVAGKKDEMRIYMTFSVLDPSGLVNPLPRRGTVMGSE